MNRDHVFGRASVRAHGASRAAACGRSFTKMLSILLSAVLTITMVPAAALAAPANNGETNQTETNQTVAENTATDIAVPSEGTESDGDDPQDESSDEFQDESVGRGPAPANGEEGIEDNVMTGEGSNLSIPAAMERINEDVALTQPVAQQESTRSYFLAQTLESTKTVPIVSANLPLDTGTADEAAEPAEGESNGVEGEGEEGEGSDDPDPAKPDLPATNVIAADSTVIGSFEYNGIIYAMEPGGETVAAVAADYAKLPEQSIEKHTLVVPSMVPVTSPYGIDFFSVTRIADYTFAGFTVEAAATRVISTEASESERSGEISDEENAAESDDESLGITILGIPSSITSIGDEAFAGFDTLQYIVVEEGNPNFASYDGALYSADLAQLRLIPGGRVGAVRVAPSATTVDPEVFSSCPSVTTVVADPESAIYSALEEFLAGSSIAFETLATDAADPAYSLAFDEEAMGTEALGETVISLESAISLNATTGIQNKNYELHVVSSTGTIYRRVNRGDIGAATSQATGIDSYTAKYASPLEADYELRGSGRIKLSEGHRLYLEVENQNNNANPLFYEFGTNSGLTGVREASLRYLTRGTATNPGYYQNTWIMDDTGNATYTRSSAKGGLFVLFVGKDDGSNPVYRTITWDGNGGTTPAATRGACANSFTVPTSSRTGYIFAGWYTAASGGVKLPTFLDNNTTKAYMPSVPAVCGYDLANASTFYAHWTAKQSALTFDLQGGSWKSDETLQTGLKATYSSAMPGIYKNNTTTKMTVPTKDGYTFAGFYDTTNAAGGGNMYYKANLDSNQNWNKDKTDGTTLYAHWAAATYTISFNKNNTTSGSTSGTTTAYQKYATGWYSNSAATSTYAISSITAPTRPGYTFKGYATSSTATTGSYFTSASRDGTTFTAAVPSNTSFTEDKTLYAVWQALTIYTITLDKNTTDSGSAAGTSPVYLAYGKGWYKTSTPSDATVPIADGGVSAPTRPGYDFKGYAISSSASSGTYFLPNGNAGAIVLPSTTAFSSTRTLYAVWAKKSVLTLTINKNTTDGLAKDGTYTALYYWPGIGWYNKNPHTDNTASRVYSFTGPSRPGYPLNCLSADSSSDRLANLYPSTTGGSSFSLGTYMISSDKTLYALWGTKNDVHKITFNKNNSDTGSTSGTTEIYLWYERDYYSTSSPTDSSSATTSIVVPTRPGYKFKGYATSSTATSASYWTTDTLSAISVANPSNTAFTSAKTLYAVWEKAAFTITFDKNNTDIGSSAGTMSICEWHGKNWYTDTNTTTTKSSITAPTRPGYRFKGYAMTSDASTASYWTADTVAASSISNPSNTTFTANVTLYAVWEKAAFTITLDKNATDATAGTASICEWHSKGWYIDANTTTTKSSITAPTRPGYKFKGYATTSNATSASYWPADTLTASTISNPDNKTFTSSQTLYAVWEKAAFTITFNKNNTDTGATAGTTSICEWHGKNWYTDANTSTVKSSITAPTRPGYKFLGYATSQTATTAQYWTTSTQTASSVTNPGNTTFTSNTTLYAVWGLGDYTITWYMKDHGENQKPTKTSYTFKETYTLPAIENVEGWDFKGWFTNDACTTPASNITSSTYGDKNFYAKWDRAQYKIEYDMNGHGTAPSAPVIWTYGYPPTLVNPAKVEGYTFGGWYTDKACSDGKQANITATSVGPITLYAKWIINSWKVKWRYDGAVGKTDSEETVDYGVTVRMKEPGENPGYKFGGWKASGADTNTYALDKTYTMKDGDVTFTAQWSLSEHTKVNLADTRLSEGIDTIWHWPERGYVQGEFAIDVKGPGQVIVTPPSVSGYEFLGWFDTEDQNENSDSHKMIGASGELLATSGPSKATTWFAHWKWVSCPVDLVAEYDDIPYVTEAGEPTSISHARFDQAFSSSVEGGTLKTLPKRTGYTFMGYYTEKNPEVSTGDAADNKFAGKQWIAADGTFSSDEWKLYPTEERGKITLYAAWRLDDCKVSFNVEDNVAPNTETVVVANEAALADKVWNYGKSKGYLPVASEDTFLRNGYAFGGWYYTKDGTISGEKVFVSDAEGNPTPANWDVVKTSITLYPAWTAKEYMVEFHSNHPQVAGVAAESEDVETIGPIAYDSAFDLSKYDAEYLFYTFDGWYTEAGELFSGAHMTNGRFTPRGMLAQTNPIKLYARWLEPGKSSYSLYVGTPGGTDLVSETQHEYKWTETIVFDGTEAPALVDGYRFVGWVPVESDAAARAMIKAGGPTDEDDTLPGFGPLSTINRFFVAKWAPVKLSLTLQRTPAEDDSAWLLATDILEDYEGDVEYEGETKPLAWSDACDELDVLDHAKARVLYYDTTQNPFVLPDVVRKGHVFEGWKLKGSNDAPAHGIVVYPSKQDNAEMRDLVYVPVFKDAVYKIVLDGQGIGEDQVFENVPYSGEFDFPYPATLNTGSVFACWATKPDTNSDAAEVFFPDDTVKLAPEYDEAGQIVKFGLAQLDEEGINEIRVYAVWNSNYNVDVPLFANLAIDTERGDVIAGVNTIAPDERNQDNGALYRIESIRYEPMYTGGRTAFQGAEDRVFLSVYAGLNTGDATDVEHLLYADNIGDDGEVTYTDAKGSTATAKPLLIELGGESTVVYGRTAPEGQASLSAVTDEDAPNGFVTFDKRNPLTVRYGLYFENPQTRKDFAFGSSKYAWLLPENDAANKSESLDPTNSDYGRRTAWSSNTVDIAKLHYTISMHDIDLMVPKA